MESTAATPAEIKSIPIDQLRPNPWNRTVFDPDAMKELVASIKSVGIKEPLIVRPMIETGTGDEGQFQIAFPKRSRRHRSALLR